MVENSPKLVTLASMVKFEFNILLTRPLLGVSITSENSDSETLKKNKPRTRVTRLGQFSQIGQSFILDSFFKLRSSPKFSR
jgi:hypothetical protein